MNDIFVKKYWDEEDVLFYLHFQNGVAVRQIEVSSEGVKYLSVDTPIQGESILYDQGLEDLNLSKEDFITNQDFENIWNNR